uniref:Uncharacterized protein n=1 Tax=Arundo donax TaxID=35708 RepID=A0A0A9G9N7_ARUDO
MLKKRNGGIIYTYSLGHHRIAVQQTCDEASNGGCMAENSNGGGY